MATKTKLDDILSELKALRAVVERLAPYIVVTTPPEWSVPVYTCGHRHTSRAEAVRCLEAQKIEDLARGVGA